MKIGLIDVDGHNFPNLALMKLSSYHKSEGDVVEWYSIYDSYDRVYMSKVFTFTPDYRYPIQSKEVIKGGTGYKMYEDLFCESVNPDYSLYPINKDWYDGETSYGFLTRGCVRKCPWCIVPKKEGLIRPAKDIEEILQQNKKAILLDNNILSCDYGIEQIEKIINLRCKVDFNQGLDARLVTDEVAKMLSKVKWIRYIRFACDTVSAVEPLKRVIERLNKYGIKNYRLFVYVLVQDIKDADDRCNVLKELGVKPFAQPYRDFDHNIEPSHEQKDFARYVNHTATFKSCTWKEYKKRSRIII
ncbi:MAG: radical SAM protein [Bacteroides xylanisolvens]